MTPASTATHHGEDDPAPLLAPARLRGITALALSWVPPLAAIWCVPHFVTQDGPAHLYNAHILVDSLGPESPFREFYRIRAEPLPNWLGHLLTMAHVAVLPPRHADRAVVTITLVAFAASMAWLRVRVAGWRGMPLASMLATVAAMNVAWLLGFTSFLLGACLFAVTLGVWWGGRDRMSLGRASGIAALLVLGYFAHLVSLGLTVIGLAVLEAFTPGPRRAARAAATAASLVPLVPLGLAYLRLSGRGGPMGAVWFHPFEPLSPRSWIVQIGWIDPISSASKTGLPFMDARSPAFALLSPAAWLAVALAVLTAGTLLRGRGDASFRGRRGWLVLASLLFAGGLFGPDSLGGGHGSYLRQRLVLLGLVPLLPALDLDPRRGSVRAAGGALAAALLLQSATVWDYALTSTRAVGALMQARDAVGRGVRIAYLCLGDRGRARLRPDPLRHAGDLFGVGTGNVVWNNYETEFYYFPVQFAEGLDRPLPSEIEHVSVGEVPLAAEARASRWADVLRRHPHAIDRLVVWGEEAPIDAVTSAAFETVFQSEKVRVLRPRREPSPLR